MAARGKVTVIKDDLFAVPDNYVLFHACNCIGAWGAGIAAAFKKFYPHAYRVYKDHCDSQNFNRLIGTSQMIPPQGGPEKHYIACLYTSRYFGKKKDSPDLIIEQTRTAFKQLINQYQKLRTENKVPAGGLVGCKINSKAFSVPWARTKAVMLEVMEEEGFTEDITIYTIDNDADEDEML